MRTSIVVALAAGVLILAVGGGYYGLEVFPQQRFRAGLDQTLAALPTGTTATYKDAHYSVLSHQAVITGLAVHGLIPGAAPQPIDLTIDSVETANPNLDFARSWANAAANPAALTLDTALPVADSIVVKGVAVHSASINMTEELARVGKSSIYPWALLHAGMPSWNEVQASLAPKAQPPSLADVQPLLRVEAALLLAVAFDSHEVGPMRVTERLPGIDIAYEVHRMTSDAFDRGVIKGMSAEGMTGHGDKIGTFVVDRLAMGAADFRAPMTRIVNGEALSAGMLDGIGIGRIDYVGMTVQPPDKPPIHVGSLSLGPVAFAQGLPVSGAIAFRDFTVSRSQLPDAKGRDAFDKLGLEAITIGFALSYDWDIGQHSVSVHDTMLKVNELGTITVTANLTNVVANVAALNQARLAHARLRFEDASLVERLLRAVAGQTGADPAAFRQQIATMVRRQSMTPGEDNPLLAAAGQAAADFITTPHSLTVELSPPVPVTYMALQRAAATPASFAAMLGLAVAANQP